MRTELVIVENCVAGAIVQTPLPSQPAPVMLNAIVSSPAFALASRIAWRSDLAPESLVFVTVNVVAEPMAARHRNRADPIAFFIESPLMKLNPMRLECDDSVTEA